MNEDRLTDLLGKLRENRAYQTAWMKARCSMEQRIWAICARYVGFKRAGSFQKALLADKPLPAFADSDLAELGATELETRIRHSAVPILQSAWILNDYETNLTKEIAKTAAELPVADWWVSHHGLALPGLGKLIAETGDLRRYPNVARLWKYLGLGTVDGERQRKKKGAEDAARHCYNPVKRSVVWQIGNSLTKCSKAYYPDLYREIKDQERQRIEASGRTIIPSAELKKIPEAKRDGYVSKGHLDNHAKRLMEKALLADLWAEWNRVQPLTPYWENWQSEVKARKRAA